MENKLILIDKKKLTITGIKKVDTATQNLVILALDDGLINIQGENLHINTLDVNNGNLELDGVICSIKFQGKGLKENLFKKVFK